jgi:rhodanese-related sulfurtransferase
MSFMEVHMTLIAMCIAVVCLMAVVAHLLKRAKARREFRRYSIEAEELHALLEAKQDVMVVDVRLPLDLLADSEIIPGAVRIAPKELLAKPEVIPAERDAVVYCTCPSDATSWNVVNRALAVNIRRIKVLRGGLAGWKAKGFPVEPYNQPFHLDVAG